MEQAIAFVTDPDLRVAAPEAADDYVDPSSRVFEGSITEGAGESTAPAE